MNTQIADLGKKLGLKLEDLHLIKSAFVYRSYLNESKEFASSNERLEYLGDAVLELATTEFLFRRFPDFQEGMLTNLRASLVRTESLAEQAHALGFPDLLLMSRGEEATGGRQNESILADTFEAFLGALYLDQNYLTVKKFLDKNLFPKIEAILTNQTYKDYKSMLQELSQARFKATPEYELIESTGPDHDKIFTMAATIAGERRGVGTGKSKQAAQEAAARAAVEILGTV